MKHVFAWIIALAVIIPHNLAAEDHGATKDEKDVLAAIQTMTGSFQSGDIDTVMNSYESKATVLFEPATPVSDRAVLEQMFTGMAAINPVFDYNKGHEVIVNGDTAVHIAPWVMTAKTPDGQEIQQSGLSIAVLNRQADGSWKMVIDNPHGGHLLN
ncbi:DUF4440 domain-containing protein [Epibacterium ulvae]|uniref:YybH family protein n=1 Tax=Epibacterium ulvae TaxID=1156985 RepID=UPI001BFCC504|nr:DUF4440 domain-containing protein [Epibacterium ulvae]MBT8152315.1 DUF4440 domain-containing protein [Epibacterium ulvae]